MFCHLGDAFAIKRFEIGNTPAQDDDVRVQHINEVCQRTAEIAEKGFHEIRRMCFAAKVRLLNFNERSSLAVLLDITRFGATATDVSLHATALSAITLRAGGIDRHVTPLAGDGLRAGDDFDLVDDASTG